METETETEPRAGRRRSGARMPEQEIFVTVSDALEYLFCPRFIFFMHCLSIAQREERRYKVLKGRELHEIREKVNRDYVRKKLNCTRKEISVYLTSHKYHFKGEVDEVLFLEDGTAAPLDYKYAEFKNTIYRTHKYQAALYGLLIMEHFGVDVKRGFVCYTRSNNYVAEIDFRQKDYEKAKEIVREILDDNSEGILSRWDEAEGQVRGLHVQEYMRLIDGDFSDRGCKQDWGLCSKK